MSVWMHVFRKHGRTNIHISNPRHWPKPRMSPTVFDVCISIDLHTTFVANFCSRPGINVYYTWRSMAPKV